MLHDSKKRRSVVLWLVNQSKSIKIGPEIGDLHFLQLKYKKKKKRKRKRICWFFVRLFLYSFDIFRDGKCYLCFDHLFINLMCTKWKTKGKQNKFKIISWSIIYSFIRYLRRIFRLEPFTWPFWSSPIHSILWKRI